MFENINQMTECVERILGQVSTDRNACTYKELMTAAYNLWSFLSFDAGCTYEDETLDIKEENSFDL